MFLNVFGLLSFHYKNNNDVKQEKNSLCISSGDEVDVLCVKTSIWMRFRVFSRLDFCCPLLQLFLLLVFLCVTRSAGVKRR